MKTKSIIEVFDYEDAGYRPLLIRPGWQIARLNYMTELSAKSLRRVERHLATDEVFLPFKGQSVLVAARESADGLVFKAIRMTPGITYNIPAGIWHAIAMLPDDVVMIVEKDNTHLNDVKYRDLTTPEYTALQKTINKKE